MEELLKSRELLQQQVSATEAQLHNLRSELENTEKQIATEKAKSATVNDDFAAQQKWPFSQDEYRRYGRQMIVEKIGLEGMVNFAAFLAPESQWNSTQLTSSRLGQLKLRDASVLIIGAGGLGCPAALYLAGAGVGTIGMVDGDTVEESNLHRQILHRTRNVGKYKVDSALQYLQEFVASKIP